MMNLWMTGHRVELPEMLAGRERRAAHQRWLHENFPGTLVCFTLNVAGPVKVFALSEEIFRRTVRDIRDCLNRTGVFIGHEEYDLQNCGWEWYYCTQADAMDVKRALLELEENTPAGRLFDIDVLRPDGTKVSREEFGLPARSCLVCGQPTIGCARSRAHTVEQIQDKTAELFLTHLRQQPPTAELIGALCRQAMLLEVYTTPKPGLVDRENNGSHTDMNVELFEKSTYALEPYMVQCAAEGLAAKNVPAEEMLQRIRPQGIEAERTMFNATEGVNTHKGMIFSMGILACAVGLLSANEGHGTAEAILDTAAKIAGPAWEGDMKDLSLKAELTAGEEQFRDYGIGGIRREAAAGYPSVRELSWPVFSAAMKTHVSWEQAGCAALMELIAHVTDTNIIHRSGRERQDEIHRKLQAELARGPLSREDVIRWDRQFIGWNVSPGGCADLLALTYFLYEIEKLNQE